MLIGQKFKIALCVVATLAVFCVPSHAFIRGGSNSNTQPLGFSTLPVGAGGFLTGAQFLATGQGMITTNSGGAYYRTSPSSPWYQVATSVSLPPTVYAAQLMFSTPKAMVVAPSSPATVYMKLNGFVLKSTDAGVSWTKLANWSQTNKDDDDPNNPDSGIQFPLMAVHPTDPNTFATTVMGNTASVGGLWYSTDGGVTITRNSTVPQSGTTGSHNGYILVAFDPNTPTTVYACSLGNGCYRSTTGLAGTFALITSSPTDPKFLTVDQFGTVYITSTSANGYRYLSGTLTQILSTGDVAGISVDPASSTQGTSKVVAVAINGSLLISTTGGGSGTFTRTQQNPLPFAQGGATFTATDIPWLAAMNYTYGSFGYASYDPSGSAPYKLVGVNGIGSFTTLPPSTSISTTTVNWDSISAAQETLVATTILAPPNGNPVGLAWDRAEFYLNGNSSAYPTKTGYAVQDILGGWHGDWATTSPSTIFMLAAQNVGNFGACCQLDMSGYSTDGGQTVTVFGPAFTQSITYATNASLSLCSGGCAALTGLNLTAGNSFSMFRASNYQIRMSGTITSYNNSTGATVVNVQNTSAGTGGSYSDWIFHTIPPAVQTGSVGGCIAASDSTNALWIPTNNISTPFYTVDQGKNWLPVSIAGIPTTGTTGWGPFSFGPSNKQCAADRVTANTFYLFNYNSGKGLYTCTVTPATPSISCSQTISAIPGTTPSNISTIKAAPGNAGHLLYMDNLGGCSASGSPLKRSQDGGANWTTVMNGSQRINSANAIGYGKIKSGQTYPAVVVVGCSDATYGLWVSYDNMVTWTNLGYPLIPQFVNDVDGDKNTEGLFYIAYAGTGWGKY